MSDKLDELYDNYNKLVEAKDNITDFESCYISILNSTKGSQQEKQLCSQFVSKFFVHFPKHYDTAIDSLLDLCEDDDLNIRRRAIKELPAICRERKEYVPKMADVLAQLLQTEDNVELNIVNQSLATLAKNDTKAFFTGFFPQIINGEDIVRERAIKFLKDKLKTLNELMTKEVEEYFLEECRKVLTDVTKDEFVTFMSLLSGLKLTKSLSGQQTLLDLVKEQAELTNPFDPSDMEFAEKLLICVKHAIPYFSQFVPSTDFVKYLCLQVLPVLDQLEAKQPGIELNFLQVLAEISPSVSAIADSLELEKCQLRVFNKLLEYMPKPPEDITQDMSGDEPTILFSHVECLLYTFHQLSKHNQQFISDNQSERVKDFKPRLQYLARGVQSYLTKLRKHLSTVKGEALKSDENKLKVMALKTTNNINVLIRDLFKVPPSFKSVVTLSWKPPNAKPIATQSSPVTTKPEPTETTETDTKSLKRQPITAPEGSDPKRERKIYAPPGGKFSSNVKRFSQNNSNRGGFRGGRGSGFRGRGFRGRSNFY